LRDLALFLADLHEILVEAVVRRGVRGRRLEPLDLLLQERDLDVPFLDFDLRFAKVLAQELYLLDGPRPERPISILRPPQLLVLGLRDGLVLEQLLPARPEHA